MKAKTQKLIFGLLIGFNFLIIGSMSSLEEYFYAARPRMPEPSLGRVFREHVKSFRGIADVYVTRLEKIPFDFMQYAFPVYCITGIVLIYIIVRERRIQRRRSGNGH